MLGMPTPILLAEGVIICPFPETCLLLSSYDAPATKYGLRPEHLWPALSPAATSCILDFLFRLKMSSLPPRLCPGGQALWVSLAGDCGVTLADS